MIPDYLIPVSIVASLAAIVGFYLKLTDRNDMTVTFDLPDADGQKLKKEADRLGVKSSDLAKAALSDLLDARDEDFHAAAERVLQKNADLYKRLA